MSTDVDAPIVFVCGECGTRIFVDAEMRTRLIESGICLECGAAASESDFERRG